MSKKLWFLLLMFGLSLAFVSGSSALAEKKNRFAEEFPAHPPFANFGHFFDFYNPLKTSLLSFNGRPLFDEKNWELQQDLGVALYSRLTLNEFDSLKPDITEIKRLLELPVRFGRGQLHESPSGPLILDFQKSLLTYASEKIGSHKQSWLYLLRYKTLPASEWESQKKWWIIKTLPQFIENLTMEELAFVVRQSGFSPRVNYLRKFLKIVQERGGDSLSLSSRAEILLNVLTDSNENAIMLDVGGPYAKSLAFQLLRSYLPHVYLDEKSLSLIHKLKSDFAQAKRLNFNVPEFVFQSRLIDRDEAEESGIPSSAERVYDLKMDPGPRNFGGTVKRFIKSCGGVFGQKAD